MAVKLKIVVGLLVIITLFFTRSEYIHAQTTPLNKLVSLSVSNIPIQNALTRICENKNFNFSYNSEIIDKDKTVSINVKNETVESVLQDIFNEEIEFKAVGNHIVLLGANEIKTREAKKKSYIITGYIIDSSTGEKISSATIFDVDGNNTGLTNNEGYYSISVPANKEVRGLNFCKRGYLDTVIIIKPAEIEKIDMQLIPKVEPIDKMPSLEIAPVNSDFENQKIVKWVVHKDVLSHSNNLKIYEKRIGQVSFLPLPGTHTSVNGAIVSHLSLNVLAGYSDGVEGIEIGGLLNIDRSYVKGAQIGGLGNIVGEKTTGLQVGGMFNINTGSVNGVQACGIANIATDTVKGVQIAGFTNILRGSMSGVQVSGFYNQTQKDVKGTQLAGFANLSRGDIKGGQVSGFINVSTQNVEGVQLSGFTNFSKKNAGGQFSGFTNISFGSIGVQISGFLNTSKENKGVQITGYVNNTRVNKGVQISGFVNRAKVNKGLQISIVNVSDTSSGYAIGLFNHVRKGYRAIELSADAVHYGNITYKTGNKKLYNIINMGVKSFEKPVWTVGVGFGTYFNLGKKFMLSIDLTANKVSENVSWEDHTNLLNTLAFSLDWILNSRIVVFAAPSFNVHISTVKNDETGDFTTDIAPYTFYESSNSNTQTQMWVGGKVGLRFILHSN